MGVHMAREEGRGLEEQGKREEAQWTHVALLPTELELQEMLPSRQALAAGFLEIPTAW